MKTIIVNLAITDTETLHTALGAEISDAEFRVEYGITRYRPATRFEPEECSDIEYGEVTLIKLYDENGEPILIDIDLEAHQELVESCIKNFQETLDCIVWDTRLDDLYD